MKRRLGLLLSILFLSCTSSFSQILKGVVVDTSGLGVPFANVVLRDSSERIAAFTSTDSRGFFTLNQVEADQGSTLYVSSMGFVPDTLMVEELTIVDNLLVVLIPNPIDFEEIKVVAKKKVSPPKDTLSFNLDYYRDSTESNIGEILAKIPGIQVDAMGNIKVYSTPIRALMIDGYDITGNKYQVITNSFRADIVQSVDVIFNYIGNDLLKTFLSGSNDIALNLVTKEEFRSSTTGDIAVGLGVKRFNLDASLFSLTKTVKLINSSGANNVGIGTHRLLGIKNPLPIYSGVKVGFEENWSASYSNLKRDITRINRMARSRIDMVIPSKNTLDFHLSLEGSLEDFRRSARSSHFTYDRQVYRIDERHDENTIGDFAAGIMLSNQISKDQHLNLLANFSHRDSRIIDNFGRASWDVSNINRELSLQTQYLRRLSSHTLGVTSLEISHATARIDMNTRIDTTQFDSLTIPFNVVNNITPAISSVTMDHGFIFRLNHGHIVTGASYSTSTISNKYFDSELPGFTDLSLDFQVNYKYSNTGSIYGQIAVGRLASRDSIESSEMSHKQEYYYSPSLEVRHSLNENMIGRIFYSRSLSLSSIPYSKEPFWTTPYHLTYLRTYFRPELSNILGYQFRYTRENPTTVISQGVSYSVVDKDYVEYNSLSDAIATTEYVEYRNIIKTVRGFVNLSLFLDNINLAVKLEPDILYSRRPRFINSSLFNTESTSIGIYTFFRSAFIFPLNFEMGLDISSTTLMNVSFSRSKLTTRHMDLDWQLQLKLAGLTIKSKTTLQRRTGYATQNSNINYFSDLSIDFAIKDFQFEIACQNIFDARQFRYISNGPISEVISTREILPRIILIKGKYKF